MSDILPPGEYDVALKLLCTPDVCQLVAEVDRGRHRGSRLVVQTFQEELPAEVQAARDQCISTLRVKYGSSEDLSKFIKETDNQSESWLAYFVLNILDRYRLYDAFSEFVYGRGD